MEGWGEGGDAKSEGGVGDEVGGEARDDLAALRYDKSIFLLAYWFEEDG